MPLSGGTRLGPYEIVALVGAGGMGEVYRARDTRLGRDVAVKVLPAGLSQDGDRVRRFEQEARAAGMLNHPNILAIYDVGTHEGSFYVVSELLDGETLKARQSGAPLATHRAIDYALQTARGLAAAHAKGIVHRDLKPENLFLTKDGHIKILDFGLAKLIQRVSPDSKTSAPTVAAETDPGVVMGTIGYMSPEQVRGQPTDHRTDIFSFGAILHEMLTGRRAFQGPSSADVMSAILKEEPAELPAARVSPGLDRVVRHCLEKRQEDRFESARDLAFALEALSGLSGGHVAVEATAAARRRPPWRALAALNVAGLAAIGFVAYRNASAPPATRMTRVTFRRGTISGARFAPDGRTIVYSAAWDGQPPAVFSTHPPSAEWRSYDFGSASLAAISSTGDMALLLKPTNKSEGLYLPVGTLAQAPVAGGSPRELVHDVTAVDWTPDGSAMAIVRNVGSHSRLEFPPGKVLYDSAGFITFPRFSPKGDQIAFAIWSPSDIHVNGLYVTDLAGKTRALLLRPIMLGLAWAPDGREVWFSAVWDSAPAEYAVDLSGKARQLLRLANVQQVQDISRDGRLLLSGSDTRASVMCLAPAAASERDLAWLDWSVPTSLSDDGKTLLFFEGHEGGVGTGGVYLRKTDGTAPVRLGDGETAALSPDGQWVVAVSRRGYLSLFPVGAGESRILKSEGFSYSWATWFPDGSRLLVAAAQRGKAPGVGILDLSENAPPKMIMPEGSMAYAISPDGREIAVRTPDGKMILSSADRGESRLIPYLAAGEVPVRWGSGKNVLFVQSGEGMTVKIYRLDLVSGRKAQTHELSPADPAGTYGPRHVLLSADGKTYAYQIGRQLSNLYLVEGLK